MPLEKVTSEPNLEGGERAISRQYRSRYRTASVSMRGSSVLWAGVASVANVSHTTAPPKNQSCQSPF